MLIQRHIHVRGLVQGVYYRDTCRHLAEESGVTGWVRNLHNGDVEAVFEGTPHTADRLVRWAAKGPGAAEVTGCTVITEHPEGHRDFRVLPDAPPTPHAVGEACADVADDESGMGAAGTGTSAARENSGTRNDRDRYNGSS